MPNGEPLVLRDEGLSQFREILGQWERKWEKNLRVDLSVFVGPLAWLIHETGICPRQLRRIRKELTQVPYSQAEKILMAIGIHGLLDNGTIEPVQNRFWNDKSFREWMEGTP